MNIESFREYCLSKKASSESMPFDDTTLVFKVLGKMFALASLDSEGLSVNLKCDPDLAEELRARYSNVTPGYHMSKRHWNTVLYDDTIGEALFKEWIDHSYQLVLESLPKKIRAGLEE